VPYGSPMSSAKAVPRGGRNGRGAQDDHERTATRNISAPSQDFGHACRRVSPPKATKKTAVARMATKAISAAVRGDAPRASARSFTGGIVTLPARAAATPL